MKALENRLRGMIARAVVRLINDAARAQELQLDLLAEESQDGVERLQNYGFTSHPFDGAEAIVASVGGLRSHMIALVVEDRRYRLTGLAPGEVAIYDDLGNVIKLGRDRIEILAASKVQLTAPDGLTIDADVTINGDVAITGAVAVDGTLTASTDVVGGGKSLKTHKHTGVQAGAAQTGEPA